MIRQAHFDQDGVCLGVVEREGLEEGAVALPEGFDSGVPARYRLVDGQVTDTHPGKSDDEVVATMSAEEAQRAAALVAARQAASSKIVTKLAFMNLLTDGELEAIYTAAQQSVPMQVWIDKLRVADYIDLNDPRTVSGLITLEMLGILGAGRADVIRANQLPA